MELIKYSTKKDSSKGKQVIWNYNSAVAVVFYFVQALSDRERSSKGWSVMKGTGYNESTVNVSFYTFYWFFIIEPKKKYDTWNATPEQEHEQVFNHTILWSKYFQKLWEFLGIWTAV